MAKTICIAALLALLAVSASASTDNVLHLSSSDFAEKTADGKMYFIKFFAPWCGHCKKLAPTWNELATAYKGSDEVVIASVDCTAGSNRPVCDGAGIKGFPTLAVYQNGKQAAGYRGARTLDALKDFAAEQQALLMKETTA